MTGGTATTPMAAPMPASGRARPTSSATTAMSAMVPSAALWLPTRASAGARWSVTTATTAPPISCDPGLGCRNVLIDGDSDGFAPTRLGTCATRPGASRDCDDDDNQRYPGAPEQCEGEDNDCDELVDEDTVRFDCFRDADGDGYPNPLDRVVDCDCPDGFMPRRADGLTDCADTNPGVNPGATEFSAVGYPVGGGRTSFDWNCDGVEERANPDACSGSGSTCTGGEWQSTTPACGEEADYCVCQPLLIGSPPRPSGCGAIGCFARFAETCR